MATVGRLNVVLGAKVRGFLAGMRKSEQAMRATKENMAQLSRAATRLSVAMGAAGAAATLVAANFEKQMTRAAAIAAGSAQGFERSLSSMSAAALDLAGRTEFTARQVGEGMEFMALAGNDAATIIEAMPSVLQLASAASLDLGRSADIVTNVMAGFGVATEDLISVNNTLVGTFTGANVTLAELGEAFKTAGPVAKALGVTIEQTAQAIGLLGNAGIKGTEAGTGLKRAFTALVNVTPKSAKAMDALGISARDLTDPKRGIGTIIAKLEGAKAAFTDVGKTAEFTALLFKVFGERAGPKMAALVEQGADQFDKLGRKIEKAKVENLAEFLETKQVATFRGQLNILISAIEKAAIAFGQRLIPHLEPLVKGLQKAFTAIGNWNQGSIDSVVAIGKWALGVTAAIAAASGLTALIAGLAAGIGALSTAATTAGVSIGVLLAGPLVAVAAGIGGFAAALSIMEARTGEAIDVLGTLKGALKFSLEGFAQAESTVLNFVLALSQLIVKIATLGTVDLTDALGNLGAQFSDAARASQDLSASTKRVLDIDKQLRDIADELAGMTVPMKEVETDFERLDGTVGKAKVTMADLGKAMKIAAAEGRELSEGELARIKELRQQQVRLALDRIKALQEVQRENQKAQEELKTRADEAAKAEADRLKRERERFAAQLRAARIAARVTDQTKEQLKALGKIAALELAAARARDIAEAGPTAEPVLRQMLRFEDFSARLETAFTKAGRPLEEMRPILDDMREAMKANIEQFVRSKEGTEEYADAVKAAKEVLGLYGIELGDVSGATGETEEFRKRLDDASGAARRHAIALDRARKAVDDAFAFGRKIGSGNLLGAITPAIEKAAKKIGQSGGKVVGSFIGIGEAAGAAAGAGVAGIVVSIFLQALQAVMDLINGLIDAAIGAVKGLVSDIGGGKVFELVGKGMKSLAGAIAALVLAFFVLVDVIIGVFLLPITVITIVVVAALAALAFAILFITGLLFLFAQAFLAGFAFAQIGETESGEKLGDAFNNALKDAAEPLEPLAQGLFALVPVVNLIVKGMNILAATFLSGLPEFLFGALKNLGIVILTVAIALEGLRIEFNEQTARWRLLFMGLQNAWAMIEILFNEMQKALVNFLGTASGEAQQQRIDELQAQIDQRTADMNALGQSMTETSQAMDDMQGLLGELLVMDLSAAVDAVMEFADGVEEVNNEMAETLTNVPAGFKVALERFRNITPGQGTAPIEAVAGQAEGGFIIENVFLAVDSDNLFALQAALQDAAQRSRQEQAGGLNGDQFRNGGGI